MEHVVTIERDEDGIWTADFADLPALHTQATSLAALRDRYREVFADFGPDDADPSFVEDLTELLPAPVGSADVNARLCLERATAARRVADRARDEALEATRLAARVLTEAGFTRREVGELLGVSHQRVQQLVRS